MVRILIQAIGTLDEQPVIPSETIYQCWQKGKLKYSPNTAEAALQWLSDNGGGLFKNDLHKYQFEVKPDEYKNLIL